MTYDFGFLPGSFFAGIVAILTVSILRARREKPGLGFVRSIALGVAAGYVIPHVVTLFGMGWAAIPGLPELPVINFTRAFLGVWVGLAVLALSYRRGHKPRVPAWVALAAGVATMIVVPAFLDRVTGSYQPASLHADVNQCTRGMRGQAQPREATNICDEPIVVGLCMPDEMNPQVCAQSFTLQPGETAQFDPGTARLSSLPSNPRGLTVVACRPPARPSRTLSNDMRSYDGVCLPPA